MPISNPASSPRLNSIAPQLVVPDVVHAAEYYRDALGFSIPGYFPDSPPLVYAIVARDGVEIHFGKSDSAVAAGNLAHRPDGLDAYVFVQGVDQLFDEFTRRRADVVEGPVDRIYKQREIVVRDCHGFVFAFGEDTSNVRP